MQRNKKEFELSEKERNMRITPKPQTLLTHPNHPPPEGDPVTLGQAASELIASLKKELGEETGR